MCKMRKCKMKFWYCRVGCLWLVLVGIFDTLRVILKLKSTIKKKATIF